MILLNFFGFIILFFVIFGLMMLFSVALRFWGFFRQLLGSNNGQQQSRQQDQWYNSQSQQEQWYNNQSQQDQWYRGGDFSNGNDSHQKESVSGQPKPRNSVVDKNEGEYVDFEELS